MFFDGEVTETVDLGVVYGGWRLANFRDDDATTLQSFFNVKGEGTKHVKS